MIEGGCNCGSVRYQIAGMPLLVAQCHCRNCRRQSGSAFSVNLLVPAKALSVSGKVSVYADPETESGEPVLRKFCPECGSPLFSESRSMGGLAVVKAGTLDDPAPFPPSVSVWTESRLPWVDLPEGQKTFPRNAS